MTPRVVVSGIGIVSPIGSDVDSFWDALMAGRIGLTRGTTAQHDAGAALVGQVCMVPGVHFRRLKAHARTLNRTFQLLLTAADEGVRNAALDVAAMPESRVGVVLGIGPLESYADLMPLVRQADPSGATVLSRARDQIDPLRRLRHLPNIAASLVSIEHRAGGPILTFVGGDSSGLLAIAEGRALIAEGVVDVAICGGADSRLSPRLLSALRGRRTLDADLTWACRPFDVARRGTVAAEGAAVLVLESGQSAQGRGVRPYAEVRGGTAGGRSGASALDQIMSRAVASGSGRTVDAVIAHGDGDVGLDAGEAAAIEAVFPDTGPRPLVTSIKANVGHAMSAAGAFNAAVACLAIRRQRIPAIPLLPQPCAGLSFVAGHALETEVNSVLVNVLEPDGTGASAVFESLPG